MLIYIMKTFDEFKNFTKNDINITGKIYTKEQFREIMKPIMCDICRRIFNPTKEESKKRLEEIKNIFPYDFGWTLELNH